MNTMRVHGSARMDPGLPALLGLPESVGDHPSAQGLGTEVEIASLGPLLAGQGGTEIGITFPHPSPDSLTHRRSLGVARCLPPMAGYQPPRARLAIAAHQTLDLPNAPTRLQRRLALTQPPVENRLHDRYPFQFLIAQWDRLLYHDTSSNGKDDILELLKDDITELR